MHHTMNHSPNLGSIRQGEGLIESLEPKTLDGLSLILGPSDYTPLPSDRDPFVLIAPFTFRCFFHASSPRPLPGFSVD
jgi:hypothetical protein